MDPADFAIEYTGGGGDPTEVKQGAMPKDNVIDSLIPEKISECALWMEKSPGEPCADERVIAKIADNFGAGGDPIEDAKKQFGCKTEKCVMERVAGVIPEARRELALKYKVKGSTGNALLSNTQIDAVMWQFSAKFPDFFPFNFNMRDYASNSLRGGDVVNTPDTLATIQWRDLYGGKLDRKYTRCGCVINSDVYAGPGKHWMALFADAGTRTVEFFNSSGNAPAAEWINWLMKTKMQMDETVGKSTIIRVTSIRHQQSKSECGVYSLFYIWARLNGVPAKYFTERPVPDKFMFEFRQHIFDDPSRPAASEFDWDKFTSEVKLKWER